MFSVGNIFWGDTMHLMRCGHGLDNSSQIKSVMLVSVIIIVIATATTTLLPPSFYCFKLRKLPICLNGQSDMVGKKTGSLKMCHVAKTRNYPPANHQWLLVCFLQQQYLHHYQALCCCILSILLVLSKCCFILVTPN